MNSLVKIIFYSIFISFTSMSIYYQYVNREIAKEKTPLVKQYIQEIERLIDGELIGQTKTRTTLLSVVSTYKLKKNSNKHLIFFQELSKLGWIELTSNDGSRHYCKNEISLSINEITYQKLFFSISWNSHNSYPIECYS